MSIKQHSENSNLWRKFINETSIYTYDPVTGEKSPAAGITDTGTIEVGQGAEMVGPGSDIGDNSSFIDMLLNGALGALIGWLVARGIISKVKARAARRQLKADFEKYKKKGLSDKKAYKKALENFKNNNPNVKELIRASKDLEKYKKARKPGSKGRYKFKYDPGKVRARLKKIPGAGRTGKVLKWLGAATATGAAIKVGAVAGVFTDPVGSVRSVAEKVAVIVGGDNPDLTKAEEEGNLIDIDSPEYLRKTRFRGTEPIAATLSDKEALMSMVFAEASWSRNYDEMAAIIQVAINRKLAWKRANFVSVVAPKKTGWNDNSANYTRNYNRAMSVLKSAKGRLKANADKVSALIDKMLAGERPVGDLGGAKNWLHAGKIERCSEPHGTKIIGKNGKIKYCFDYSTINLPFGKRKLPTWAIQRGNGPGQLPAGRSKSRPTAVGTMVYSNGGKSLVARVPKKKVAATTTSRVTSSGKIKNVAVIGDSIMATSLGAGGRLKKILQKDGINVNNLAVGSKTMQKVGKNNNHIAAQWNMVKQQGKVDVLVINGGTNDVLGMAWTSKTRRGQKSIEIFSNIVSEATSMGMKVLIFPILLPNKGRLYEPGGKLPENHPRRYTKEQIQQECTLWNNKLKQIANSSPNAFYVGGFEGMLISSGRRKSWLNSKDKVHPKGPESQKIASKLAEMIRGF